MIEIELYPYILLGDSIRFLRDVKSGMPIGKPVGRDEPSLYKQIFGIHDKLLKMGLTVTLEAYRDELGDLMGDFYNEVDEGSSTPLTERQADDILRGMMTIAMILKYEAKKLQAYVVTEKRLPVNKLLSGVGSLFGNEVFNVLPDLVQYDFRQAGKSIAFELPTAAAFHILRGTEGVLRSYYASLIPSASIQPHTTWGPMVADLRKISNDTPPKELLDNLDNIRVSFRNPTQHPEKTYDLDEAQDLFNLCVDAINRMAKDLFRRKIWKPAESDAFLQEDEIPF